MLMAPADAGQSQFRRQPPNLEMCPRGELARRQRRFS
jgi:hypothetical protein